MPEPSVDPGSIAKREADAVRWLHRSFRAGAAIDAVATVGMIFPRQLWTARFRPPLDRSRPEFAYGMRTGAPLMAGWTALLLWADRAPLERSGVLALTALPVVAGLMANDAAGVRAGHLARSSVMPVRVLQAALLMLFATAHLRARQAIRRPAR